MDRSFLAECEREPLQFSGAILAHGTLLVVAPDGRVSHVAANVADWLGTPAEALLGLPAPENMAAALLMLPPKAGSRLALEAALHAAIGLLDLVASRDEHGAAVVELMRHYPDAQPSCDPSVPDTPRDEAELTAAEVELVRLIVEMTGFRRVMYYRFHEEGDGEVIAEARLDETYGSYLGLRFPASDIPLIARVLYLKNPWRLIPDAASEPVPVLGREAAPPDLACSDLRSVSAVHRLYLTNMGVRASLSFPVIVGGTLIALIACHHDVPQQPSLAVLELAHHLVRGHANAVGAYQLRRRMRWLDGLERHLDAAKRLLQRHGDMLLAWPELGTRLLREFKADGVTLCLGESHSSAGQPFEAGALEALDGWFRARQGEFVWSSDSLSQQVPGYPLSEIVGALAVRVKYGRTGDLRVYFCRLEHVHEVAWGGNPDKPVGYHDGAIGIAPRRSFEKWVEKRLGYSRPWDNEARLLGFKLRELLGGPIPAGIEPLWVGPSPQSAD